MNSTRRVRGVSSRVGPSTSVSSEKSTSRRNATSARKSSIASPASHCHNPVSARPSWAAGSNTLAGSGSTRPSDNAAMS